MDLSLSTSPKPDRNLFTKSSGVVVGSAKHFLINTKNGVPKQENIVSDERITEERKKRKAKEKKQKEKEKKKKTRKNIPLLAASSSTLNSGQ